MQGKLVMLGVWKWQGVVLHGGTEADFVALARTLVAPDIEAHTEAAGRALARPGRPWLLWVESLQDVPALAHEALHITAGILEMRGLKHSAESEEAYTYTMEYILREALSADDWMPTSDLFPEPESAPVAPSTCPSEIAETARSLLAVSD